MASESTMRVVDSRGSPKVSVIMPAYNRAHLIKESIASVLAQTLSDLELLVVDDQSTDDTEAVIKDIQDTRVRYVRNTGRKGVSAARNAGISNARGRWVGFLDSDDQWLPSKLEQQVAALEKSSDAIGIGCGWRWINKQTEQVRIERIPDADGRIDRLPRWVYNICQDLVIRREILEQEFFDESLTTYECFDWTVRLWRTGRFDMIPATLVECYEHPGPRASDGQLRCLHALEQVMARYEPFVRSDSEAWSYLNLRLGAGFLVAAKDHEKARSYLLRALYSNPWVARVWVYSAASLLPVSIAQRIRSYFTSSDRDDI